MKLNLKDIFSGKKFVYDNNRKCYRPNVIDASIKFPFRNEIGEKLFMIAIKYNAIRKPQLELKVNNRLINSNLLTHRTMSYDMAVSHRYEFGPFLLKPKENYIELVSTRIFPDIYEIEIYPQKDNLNKVMNPFSYNYSDFVLIENYNTYGGFFWHINNFLMCCYFCEKFNKIPIVNFDRSMYINNTCLENPLVCANENWFYNYFKNYSDISPSLYQAIINCPNKVAINAQTVNTYKMYKVFCKNEQVLYFNRQSFDIMKKKFYESNTYSELVAKYLKPLPHIERMVSDIKKNKFPEEDDNTIFFGVHYRGTDKISESKTNEGQPKGFNYETFYNIISRKCSEVQLENNGKYIYIIVCSDEIPFIEFMNIKFPGQIIHYNEAYRSKLNTSNLKLDFTNIYMRDRQVNIDNIYGHTRTLVDKRNELIDNSIHMGNKNLSNYKKGLDCLIDVLLVSKVDKLFISKGNFSLYCHYFNTNPNLEVIKVDDVVLNPDKYFKKKIPQYNYKKLLVEDNIMSNTNLNQNIDYNYDYKTIIDVNKINMENSSNISTDPGLTDTSTDPGLTDTSTDPEINIATDPEINIATYTGITDTSTDPGINIATDTGITDTSTDPEINISTDPGINISTDPGINISTDPEINISTDPEINISTDPEINIATDPEINISTDPEINISTDDNLVNNILNKFN